MKNIGKLGKTYARFNEGGLEDYARLDYSGTVKRKGRKPISCTKMNQTSLLLYPFSCK